jgi:hypothetical protein
MLTLLSKEKGDARKNRKTQKAEKPNQTSVRNSNSFPLCQEAIKFLADPARQGRLPGGGILAEPSPRAHSQSTCERQNS